MYIHQRIYIKAYPKLHILSKESRTLLLDLLRVVFNAFDFNKLGKADAAELVCGLTVLHGGSKSDKLEYAFELLDKDKKGTASRFQMVRYLLSFLLVLLNISSCSLGQEPSEDILHNEEGGKAEGNIALQKVICSVSHHGQLKRFLRPHVVKERSKRVLSILTLITLLNGT
jgi:hypothetical protein